MDEKPTLNDFQLRNVRLLTHLYSYDAISDDIVEEIRNSELDYFALLEKYKVLEQKINIDEKTNVLKFKKDYLLQILKTASRIYKGKKEALFQLTLIRFDLDDFSKINNQFGHETGDIILVQWADLLRANTRPTDYVIRFGGEEFDVILPATGQAGAERFIQKILDVLRKCSTVINGEKICFTVSAGLVYREFDLQKCLIINQQEIDKVFHDLHTQVDNALYEAKYLGKNRYCVYDPSRQDEYKNIRKLYVYQKQ